MPIHFSTQENLFSLKVRFFKNLKLHSSKVILTTIILKESLANQNHLGGLKSSPLIYNPWNSFFLKKILLLKSLFYSPFIWQRGYKIRSRQKHWTHGTVVVISQKGLKYAAFSYSFLEIFCFYQLYFETTVAQTRLWEIVIQQFENVSADFSFTAYCHPSWSHLTKYLPYNFSPFSLPIPEFSSSSSPTWITTMTS